MSKPTFLVALDVTEDPVSVLDAAKALADKCGAELHLMTVVQPVAAVYGSLYAEPYAFSSVEFEEASLAAAHDKLRALCAKNDIADDNAHSRLGSPEAEIRAAAAELNCDLLIMGTHARTGLARILGSTASAVLHGIECDVHLVNLRRS